jgi:hypothetical protein
MAVRYTCSSRMALVNIKVLLVPRGAQGGYVRGFSSGIRDERQVTT